MLFRTLKSYISKTYAESLFTRAARPDFLLAAFFLCRTPFETALSSLRLAVRSASVAASRFEASTAWFTLRMLVFRSDLIVLLRRRAFSLVRMRFFWDLMLATCITFCLSNWSVRATLVDHRLSGVGMPMAINQLCPMTIGHTSIDCTRL